MEDDSADDADDSGGQTVRANSLKYNNKTDVDVRKQTTRIAPGGHLLEGHEMIVSMEIRNFGGDRLVRFGPPKDSSLSRTTS